MSVPIPMVRFLNILVVAMLAGMSLGIWIGFNPSHLSYPSYLEQQQHMLHSLKAFMISMVAIAISLTLLQGILQRKNKAIFTMLLVAGVCLLSCMLITVMGNGPIDEAVNGWTANSAPGNWTDLRDRWWILHKARTLTEIMALTLVTWAGIKKDA
jgi:hypothetical protein